MTPEQRRWHDLQQLPAYSFAEAAHYLSMPQSTVRSWFRGQRGFESVISIADPAVSAISFVNLVEAHVLSAIRRRHNIPLPRVRNAIEYVSKSLGGAAPLGTPAIRY